MTEGDAWAVAPRVGLGALRFGMSAAQVDAWSTTYGAVTGRRHAALSEAILQETLDRLGHDLDDDARRELLAVYAEHGPSPDRVIEARGEPGLVLGYEADRLVSITTAHRHRPLRLDGVDLLGIEAREALAHLERHNGGPGRYSSTSAMFDTIAIVLDSFCVTDEDGVVRPLDASDERFHERTIWLLPKPEPVHDPDTAVVRTLLG